MKRRRNLTIAVVAVLSAILVMACAQKKLELAPEQEKDRAYYELLLDHADAQKKFAEAELKYNTYYDAADKATKDYLTENVDPLWVQASDALDIWETAIKGGGTGEDELMAYKRLKSVILMKLPDLIWSD